MNMFNANTDTLPQITTSFSKSKISMDLETGHTKLYQHLSLLSSVQLFSQVGIDRYSRPSLLYIISDGILSHRMETLCQQVKRLEEHYLLNTSQLISTESSQYNSTTSWHLIKTLLEVEMSPRFMDSTAYEELIWYIQEQKKWISLLMELLMSGGNTSSTNRSSENLLPPEALMNLFQTLPSIQKNQQTQSDDIQMNISTNLPEYLKDLSSILPPLPCSTSPMEVIPATIIERSHTSTPTGTASPLDSILSPLLSKARIELDIPLKSVSGILAAMLNTTTVSSRASTPSPSISFDSDQIKPDKDYDDSLEQYFLSLDFSKKLFVPWIQDSHISSQNEDESLIDKELLQPLPSPWKLPSIDTLSCYHQDPKFILNHYYSNDSTQLSYKIPMSFPSSIRLPLFYLYDYMPCALISQKIIPTLFSSRLTLIERIVPALSWYNPSCVSLLACFTEEANQYFELKSLNKHGSDSVNDTKFGITINSHSEKELDTEQMDISASLEESFESLTNPFQRKQVSIKKSKGSLPTLKLKIPNNEIETLSTSRLKVKVPKISLKRNPNEVMIKNEDVEDSEMNIERDNEFITEYPKIKLSIKRSSSSS